MKLLLRLAVTGSTITELVANASKVLNDEIAKEKVQIPRILNGKKETAGCMGLCDTGEDYDWDVERVDDNKLATLFTR